MRPVTRGAPASYPADYLTDPLASPGVVASATTLQGYIDRIDVLRQRNATILNEIAAVGVALPASKKRKKNQSTLSQNLNVITALQLNLEAAYQTALTSSPLDRNALATAARDLTENLDAQIEWYTSNTDPHQKRINGVYGLARGDLITNIGQYCSYCEMPLAASLAVEHMLPKADFPIVALSWTNFLLACSVCNAYKNAKPSRETGKKAALAQGIPPPPNNAAIRTAALSTYLWPNDGTTYTNWQTFFRFQMKKVLYGNDGTLLSSTDIPDHVVKSWGFGDSQVTLLSESGYAINVRFVELLSEIKDYATWTILQDLRRDTIDQPLQDALTGLAPDYRLNFVDTTPQLTRLVDTIWRVTERRQYTVDATTQRSPAFSEVGSRDITRFSLPTAKSQRAFFTALGRGDLPAEIKAILMDPTKSYLVNPATQRVEITQTDRTTYAIVVEKTLDLVDDGGVIQVYNAQEYQVELHLAPVGGPAAAKAKQVIDDLQLNHIDPTETRFSDRRMVKRTKTWFVALEAVRHLNAVVTSGGMAFEPAIELAGLITQTAIATGFWSVWWSVFHTFLAPTIRDQLTNFLTRTQNFPGVR